MSGQQFSNPNENRALILVDGDNLRGTCRDLQRYIRPQRLYQWFADGNLGITSITYACFLLSRLTLRPLGFEDRWSQRLLSDSPWLMYRYRFNPGERGYSDDAVHYLALSLIDEWDTLVIISSDGGSIAGDGGFPEFRRQLVEAHTDKEVVLIGSRQSIPRGWTRRAKNYEFLEDIFPELTGLPLPV